MPGDEKLIQEIALLISEATGQKNLDLSKITPATRLTDDPFNLDSIDILESVATIEEKYKVHIVDAKDGAKHFQSLQTIADFVNAKK
jgi:acyl carrier protein